MFFKGAVPQENPFSFAVLPLTGMINAAKQPASNKNSSMARRSSCKALQDLSLVFTSDASISANTSASIKLRFNTTQAANASISAITRKNF